MNIDDNMPPGTIFYKWDYETAFSSSVIWPYWTSEMVEEKHLPLASRPHNQNKKYCSVIGSKYKIFTWLYPTRHLIEITREEAEAMIIMGEMK